MNKLWTKDFIFLSLSNLFMFGSFYMLLPTLPLFIVDSLQGEEKHVGLIIGLFSAAQIFSRPLTGRWLDYYSRKHVFLLARILFALCMFFYLGIASLFVFFLLRFVHGFGFGMATTASGTIASDIIPQERRAEGMGYYSTFASIAMIVGPFLGLVLLQAYDFYAMFLICTLLSITSFVLGYFIKVSKTEKSKERSKKKFKLTNFFEYKVVPISIVSGLMYVLYGGIVSFISLYAKERGNVDLAGYFLGILSIALIFARPLSGKVSDKYGSHLVVFPGFILAIIGVLLLSQTQTVLTFNISAALIGISFGLMLPSLHATMLELVPAERRGTATATYFMGNDIGIASGSFILGFIANYLGYAMMYLSSTLFIVLSFISYLTVLHKKRLEQKQETSLSS
ncbi:MFS transporter [Bacillus sp. SM2101]|uniref:MFS transporter n=1 Tax=Bacillus sp. SM2101 TaxID=2805366 RepID=UPI001BDDDC3D|nr:MFS transporter [Bacillus sp. SM2101]